MRLLFKAAVIAMGVVVTFLDMPSEGFTNNRASPTMGKRLQHISKLF
ncbi:MAG: hypothetical protein ACK4SY_05380 [Pyrobaculum sp.]